MELRDLENLFDFRRKPNDFHGAASLDYAHVVANQFANSRTVQVFEARQIQNDVGVAVFEQILDHFAECRGFEGSQPTSYIDEGDAI